MLHYRLQEFSDMSVSIENTSGIPVVVWIIGFAILAAIIIFAISRGHHVKIGPLEFDGKEKQSEQQPSTKEEPPKQQSFTREETKAAPVPSQGKTIDPMADPLFEGKAHLFGTARVKDYELAYLYLTKAADAGQRDALFFLGFMYEKGLYVQIDYQKSMSLYRQAADQGHPSAMSNIGFMFERGLGVTQDYQEAVSWYNKAVDLGEPAAMGNLGRLYKNGYGVPQDYNKALQLYNQAISKGNESAMNNLAVMYEDGTGVAQDYAQAIHWYQEAAKNGNKSAPVALERLKKSNPELFR